MNIARLQVKAKEIRKRIIETVYASGYGYLGASLSCVDLLVAFYYGKISAQPILSYDVKKPGSDKQDYFLMSKLEATLAQSVVLADLGFLDEDDLEGYTRGGLLKFSPHRKVPGVMHTVGSHADSLGFAAGLAISLKKEKANNMVYVLCADYELQRASFWENLLLISQYKCENLVLIIDNANLQVDSFVKSARDVMPIQQKIEAFGFKVIQILDGHSYEEIFSALSKGWRIKRQPVCLWAHTVSGYGVPFAENRPGYFASQFSANEFKEAQKILRDF